MTTGRRRRSGCRSTVGANKSERFTAYARPGSREPEFTIRLLDQNGRRVGGASQDDGDAASPRVDHAERERDPDHGPAAGGGDDRRAARLQGRRLSAVRTTSALEEIVTARIDPQSGSMPGPLVRL